MTDQMKTNEKQLPALTLTFDYPHHVCFRIKVVNVTHSTFLDRPRVQELIAALEKWQDKQRTLEDSQAKENHLLCEKGETGP